MGEGGDDSGTGMKHTAFHRGFIWVALTLGFFVGFALGTHLSFVLGFGFGPGPGFASFVQTHGHVQLVGWAGLFIMGISLYFIPRLAGAPIARPGWMTWILWLMTCGLALRTLSHTMAPYLAPSPWLDVTLWVVAASGGLEWVGIILYAALLVSTIWQVQTADMRPALRAVRPYFLMVLLGWVLYACFNLILLLTMALHRQIVVHPFWYYVATQSFLGLILLPVAFAFSVRLLPLYLRLPVPAWSVRGTAYAYLGGWLMHMIPMVPPMIQVAPQGALFLSQLGMLGKGAVMLWFVWRLDVLSQCLPFRGTASEPHPPSGRRPARPERPDHEAFGRFERLIYAAYIWLALAACGDIIAGIAGLAGYVNLISRGAIRHMYFLGFISLLIFGVAVRMLPGLLHKRRVASPGLVAATFWLGNAAVICRIFLVAAPAALWQIFPGLVGSGRIAFALSGAFGLAAVGCLAANLWRTAKLA